MTLDSLVAMAINEKLFMDDIKDEATYLLDESKLLVHFRPSEDTVTILRYDEEASVYYQISQMGVEVIRFLQNNHHCTRDQILAHLVPLYDGTADEIDAELVKLLKKLKEHSLL